MRSRTIREGSVGLLILAGLGIFGGIVLWLRGFQPGARSYIATVEFSDVAGMQAGAPVRYRGVAVGKIAAVRPGANVVEVDIEISPATLVMPRSLLIEANQSGLIGETSIDITPLEDVPSDAIDTNPLLGSCNREVVVCDGSRLEGDIGVSFTALIRQTIKFTELFSDPAFFSEVRTLTRNSANAANSVATLSKEVTSLTRSVQQDLGQLSDAAAASATSVGQAAGQFGLTAAQVNDLLASNRSSLISTLDNINQTSVELRSLFSDLRPEVGEQSDSLFANLQTLSNNAAEASANLRNLTESIGSPENVLMLQQTLDSARATFQNTQKITADLDELTGDPAFRSNLRDLVNSLNNLVSSTQQLEQQTALTRVLITEPIAPTSDSPTSDSSTESPPLPPHFRPAPNVSFQIDRDQQLPIQESQQ